ncbi:threonine/serine dehydratase [Paenibacillus shunpengii]|uniref:Threonine/serine dehydratase n=1 Tax=Paenibacillus shunpengii TaxID=2054424 RepID=A0ABW5SGS4_9BACL|nr:threonine/serine dehydratase [Paenibacillus sp. FSL H7-0326]
MLQVSLLDILQAHRRIRDLVRETPLIRSEVLSAHAGADIWLKMEGLQTTGSFKLRGAYNKILSLTNEERRRGVVTASSGNHAQAIAYVASRLNISALIIVPGITPETKKAGILRYGGELIVYGDKYDDAEAYALELSRTTGRTLIHGSEDNEIIAGQGTVALEALMQMQDFDAILVPAGGGGILCGTAAAAKAINPRIQVIGVQTDTSAPFYHSFKAKQMINVEFGTSIADGLYGGITQANLEMALQLVDDFALVQEDQLSKAIYWMAREHHAMIEGAAAVGIAALLSDAVPNLRGKKILTVVTGSNVDSKLFTDIMHKHEYAF